MHTTLVILTRDRWPRLRETVTRLRALHPGVPDPVSATHERQGRVIGVQSTALVVRREAFLAAGGFNRRFRIGAEELPAMQLLGAGWRLDDAPEALLHHEPVARGDHTREHRPLTRPRNPPAVEDP